MGPQQGSLEQAHILLDEYLAYLNGLITSRNLGRALKSYVISLQRNSKNSRLGCNKISNLQLPKGLQSSRTEIQASTLPVILLSTPAIMPLQLQNPNLNNNNNNNNHTISNNHNHHHRQKQHRHNHSTTNICMTLGNDPPWWPMKVRTKYLEKYRLTCLYPLLLNRDSSKKTITRY
ncbi:hypothetical protein BCR42DRAFT_429108 [Absidia repens]|uniref:Uncharacterized protein n=1 Tax=Absidia repens TaxID=90262 RepID=A0A1X2HXI0_9FUNG|nr:hypothetical protein BCR42DRAFT_429108 [Absidia repens]